MKNPSEQDIIKEIDLLIYSFKEDWGRFGDLSCWVIEDVIRRLQKIKRMTKLPHKVLLKRNKK